ncbi:MAG: hypothetical protein JWN41_1498, partial [Thermoleophilia bacterium]|nr:hypothetical protein [Thermoleophilia bacterium]
SNASLAQKTIDFRPVAGVRYTLTPIKSNGTSTDPSRPSYSGTTDSFGAGVVQTVIAGQYKITFSAVAGMAPWDDHSLPGSGLLSVSTGSTTHVSELFQPLPRTVTVKFSNRKLGILNHILHDPNPEVTSDVVTMGADESRDLRLVAAPLERVPMFLVNPPGKVLGDGSIEHVDKGTTSVTFTNVSPGLYTAYVVEGTDTTNSFLKSNVDGGRLSSQPQVATGTTRENLYDDLAYIWVPANRSDPVYAWRVSGQISNEIWFNTMHTSCEPVELCTWYSGGSSGVKAKPHGRGAGGL